MDYKVLKNGNSVGRKESSMIRIFMRMADSIERSYNDLVITIGTEAYRVQDWYVYN